MKPLISDHSMKKRRTKEAWNGSNMVKGKEGLPCDRLIIREQWTLLSERIIRF